MADTKKDQAKSLLVRYIRDNQLTRGARMPGHDYFRRHFGFGTTTIAAAIRELRDDAVLEVRDKVGIFVLDPQTDGHVGRKIGLTVHYTRTSPSTSIMLDALQERLAREGCLGLIFRQDRGRTENLFRFSLDHFPGLRRSVEAGELSGVIHLDDFDDDAHAVLRDKGVPALFLGAIGASPNGLFLDQARVLRDMGERLRRVGARRPALLCFDAIRHYLEPLFRAFAPHGEVYVGRGAVDGEAIARAMLARPRGERHDWVLGLDDMVTQSALAHLVRHRDGTDMPGVMALWCRQNPMTFPVAAPVLFDMDLAGFSGQAVDMLIQTLRTGGMDCGRTLFPLPECLAAAPAHREKSHVDRSAVCVSP